MVVLLVRLIRMEVRREEEEEKVEVRRREEDIVDLTRKRETCTFLYSKLNQSQVLKNLYIFSG